MSTLNNAADNTHNVRENKYCSRCKKAKSVAKFTNKIATFPYAGAERDRQNRQSVRVNTM